MTWRVFVGQWNDGAPEWAHLDERGLTWEQARDRLIPELEAIRKDMQDVCDACAGRAAAGIERLRSGPPDTELPECEVDGEDYLLLRQD